MTGGRPPLAPPDLTARQIQVLELLAEGLDAHGIAARLHLAYSTVKSHVAELLCLLGASNRAHAVAIGYQRGLLSLGDWEAS